MKGGIKMLKRLKTAIIAILFLAASIQFSQVANADGYSPVSYIDYSGAKATMMVDNKPFFYTGAQISANWLKDINWTWTQIAPIIEQAANDGYTAVTVPIRWAWIAPTENSYDWTDVDALLYYCNLYGIKCEILWFGSDVCGKQTGTPNWVKNKYQPVLKSDGSVVYDNNKYPKLDKTDPNLLSKEKSTVTALMNHIRAKNTSEGYSSPVIGVQVLNECSAVGLFGSSPTDRSYSSYANALWLAGGYTDTEAFNTDVLYNYLNSLSESIKTSDYSVWTRVNYSPSLETEIGHNLILKKAGDENCYIDFIGVDAYSDDSSVLYGIANQWNYVRNLSEIMENGGNYSNTEQLLFNTYAENAVYDVFELVNTNPNDSIGFGMYTTNFTTKTFTASSYITGVRNILHMFQKDSYDLATKEASTNGTDAVFFNRDFSSAYNASADVGIGNNDNQITYSTSGGGGGIAMVHDSSTTVFMSTASAQFSVPSTYHINSLECGYYDNNNNWVSQSTVEYTTSGDQTIFSIGSYQCIRMTYYDASNLAHGKTAAMLNGEVGWAHYASYAVDGDFSTYAQSSQHVLWDLQIDLGSAQTFDKVVFCPGPTNHATQYDIQVSADGITFTTVATENAGAGSTEAFDFPKITARYVKIHVRADAGLYHVIRDVGVYNSSLSLGQTATMIGATPGGTHSASCAIDGNVNTYAQSSTDVPWSLQIDLGRTKHVNKVTFTPDAYNYATQYDIQVSTDGTSYFTVAKESAGDGTEKTYYFPTVNARYVKILVSAEFGTNHAIREVGIYDAQNFAIGKPAWMLGDTAGWEHFATYAVDGTTGEYAQSASDSCWDILIDLGKTRCFSKVAYIPGTSNYASQYDILVSSDGVNFTTVTSENNGIGQPMTYNFAAVNARYVKIHVRAETGSNHVVREIGIYR